MSKNKEIIRKIQENIKKDQMLSALESMLKLLQDTPANEWKLYSEELTNIWQLYLSKPRENMRFNEIFEHTLVVVLEYAIKDTIDLNVLEKLLQMEEFVSKNHDVPTKKLSYQLRKFSMMAMQQSAQKNAWSQVEFFAKHIDRMSKDYKLSVQENLIMADMFHRLGDMEKVYNFTWNAMANNNPSKVCISATVYNLLLYMILFPDWRDTCFIIGHGIPIDIENKLLSNGIAGLYPARFSHIVDPLKDVIKKFAVYVKEKNVPVYGQDHYMDFRTFIKDGNFSVIEEGIGNYRPSKLNYRLILENGKEHMPFGYDNYIKSVYLTGRLDIPKELQKKAIVFDMKKLWDQKNVSEKNILLDIFSVPDSKLFKLLEQNKNQIFLTQAFQTNPVGGLKITQEKMIIFYKKILKNYDSSRVIIKVHPRDDIDYEKYFPNYSICYDRFPFEFLYLMNMLDKVDKLISINSTAAYGLPENCKIDLYEQEWKEFIRN